MNLMATTYEFDPQAAVAHLRHVDRGMDRLIQQVGTLELPIKRSRSVFEYLVRSIVYQQLSGKAAATIHARLLALFQNRRIDPERTESEDLLLARYHTLMAHKGMANA